MVNSGSPTSGVIKKSVMLKLQSKFWPKRQGKTAPKQLEENLEQANVTKTDAGSNVL